jgi:hypothetical protein
MNNGMRWRWRGPSAVIRNKVGPKSLHYAYKARNTFRSQTAIRHSTAQRKSAWRLNMFDRELVVDGSGIYCIILGQLIPNNRIIAKRKHTQ